MGLLCPLRAGWLLTGNQWGWLRAKMHPLLHLVSYSNAFKANWWKALLNPLKYSGSTMMALDVVVLDFLRGTLKRYLQSFSRRMTFDWRLWNSESKCKRWKLHVGLHADTSSWVWWCHQSWKLQMCNVQWARFGLKVANVQASIPSPPIVSCSDSREASNIFTRQIILSKTLTVSAKCPHQ